MTVERDADGAVARIVCDGRAVDDKNRAVGPTCGSTLGQARIASPLGGPLAVARAAGWRIGAAEDAMCPRCGKPDPAIAKGLAAK